jgi:hypothetical protein
VTPAELKTRYLALQQDADFALWRSRECNAEMRRCVAQQGQGGSGPTPEQLQQAAELEQQAEEKYRELRSFLREHFENLTETA